MASAVAARAVMRYTCQGGGPAEGTFTEVMEKTAQGWQVIFSEIT